MSDRDPVRFRIIKDPWCKYELQDGTTFKIRYALKEVWGEQRNGETRYNFEAVLRQEWNQSPKLRGTPTYRKHTKEELNANIEVEDCPYDTKYYERSEFDVENRVMIVLHPNLIRVSRTILFNENGDREYSINVDPLTSTIIKK